MALKLSSLLAPSSTIRILQAKNWRRDIIRPAGCAPRLPGPDLVRLGGRDVLAQGGYHRGLLARVSRPFGLPQRGRVRQQQLRLEVGRKRRRGLQRGAYIICAGDISAFSLLFFFLIV